MKASSPKDSVILGHEQIEPTKSEREPQIKHKETRHILHSSYKFHPAGQSPVTSVKTQITQGISLSDLQNNLLIDVDFK